MSPQAGERIRVLIVDDVPETRENLRKLLSFDVAIEVVGAASSGLEGIELAREVQPHVILMDINMPDMDGITATEVILQDVPTAQVVMLSVQSETDYMRRAMLAGARDFLTKPPSGDELMSTIHRVYEMGQTRAALMAPAQSLVPMLAQAEGAEDRRDGKVIAVFSPKGGVGCTTVAVNTAIALQQMTGHDRKVALVDANFQFGDVAVMLNLQPNRSIVDLLPEFEELDKDMLDNVLTAHGSGIKVLLAPPHPEAAESLMVGSSLDGGTGGNATLRAIFGLMCEEFDIVVVDIWSWMDDIALTIFDVSALIVLVITPDIPSIKSARLFLEVASKLNYPVDGIALVVNGVDPSGRISVEQIEQAITPVAAQIPLDERAVLAAANHGTPFVLRDRSRPVSQAIIQLAEYIEAMLAQVEEDAEEAERGAATAGPSRVRPGRIFG